MPLIPLHFRRCAPEKEIAMICTRCGHPFCFKHRTPIDSVTALDKLFSRSKAFFMFKAPRQGSLKNKKESAEWRVFNGPITPLPLRFNVPLRFHI
jgi:hypothetical protein